jgi:hypothetical protein
LPAFPETFNVHSDRGKTDDDAHRVTVLVTLGRLILTHPHEPDHRWLAQKRARRGAHWSRKPSENPATTRSGNIWVTAPNDQSVLQAKQLKLGERARIPAQNDSRDSAALELFPCPEPTSKVAQMFDLTAARVSQLRQELKADWQAFQGEPVTT